MAHRTITALLVCTLLALSGSQSFAQEGTTGFSLNEEAYDLEIHEVQQTIIKLFNANNSANRFDIRCQKIHVTGSAISKAHLCSRIYAQILSSIRGFSFPRLQYTHR